MSNKNQAMTEAELLQRIAQGEDSRLQFKRTVTHIDALATELVAFSNSGGGTLLLGVNDDGSIACLDAAEVRGLNQVLSNTASQHLRPPIGPFTENVLTGQGLVIVVQVPNGLSKPYFDHQGRIWVKQGADKRQVTAREELQRMFQSVGLVHADLVPVADTTSADIDEAAFRQYLKKHYGTDDAYAHLPLDAMLHNLGQGSGIPRALREWPQIELISEGRGNQFSAVAKRPKPQWQESDEQGAGHATAGMSDPVTDPVQRLLLVLIRGALSPSAIQQRLALKHRPTFRANYLRPALEQGLIEPTVPDRPNSRLQQYQLTAKGTRLLQDTQGVSK